jgi:hypothetical protein
VVLLCRPERGCSTPDAVTTVALLLLDHLASSELPGRVLSSRGRGTLLVEFPTLRSRSAARSAESVSAVRHEDYRSSKRSGAEEAVAEAEMTTRDAEEFVGSVPWQAVKMVEVGDSGETPDPHEYVIKDWREVDTNLFDVFVRLIKAEG